MARIYLVTLRRLNRALAKVISELDDHGLWDDRLSKIDVYLVPIGGLAYGWCWYGASGDICIPAVGVARLSHYICGSYVGLADVLRHEYAHALAHTHRGLLRSQCFREAFGASHDSNCSPCAYDCRFHFTEYGATDASEDFAEAFMLYLRHKGRLPKGHDTKAKRAKWRFIKDLGRVISQGRLRW